MPRLLAAPLSAALVALVVGVVPAHAQTWDGNDPHGDARSFDVDITAKCETIPFGVRQPRDQLRDITRLSVEHSTEHVVVAMTLRKVVRHDKETTYEAFVRTPGRIFQVDVVPPSVHPRVEISTVRIGRNPECGRVLRGGRIIACDEAALDVDPRADQVTFTIPRACLGSPRWVRVGALAGGFDRSQIGQIGPSTTHITVAADVWGPRGTALGELLPPAGPRVQMG